MEGKAEPHLPESSNPDVNTWHKVMNGIFVSHSNANVETQPPPSVVVSEDGSLGCSYVIKVEHSKIWLVSFKNETQELSYFSFAIWEHSQ